MATPKGKAARARADAKYRATPKGKATRVLIDARKNPAARPAHSAVNNAIRDGRLVREPCFIDGAAAEAHHSSYAEDMRLAVTWLCPKHHRQLHREHQGSTP